MGRGEALRRAIAATASPYWGLLDSDDVLAFNAVAETVRVLESEPESGMVYTQYYRLNEQGQVQGLGRRCQIPYSQERLLVDFMTFHFRLMRRRIYEQVGGIDSSFNYAQDYDLCLKVSEVTQIVHLPKPLYYYRWHQHSISCEKQLEQIQYSQRAVEQALKRRGLDQEVEIEVRLQPQFVLKRKRVSMDEPFHTQG